MIESITEFFSSPEVEVVWKYFTIFILPIIGYSLKYITDKIGLRYKLWITYRFDQKKAINEQYSKFITPLLKDAEELNHRLWNLKNNIHKKWNKVDKKEWNNPERYYIRSFTYRLLSFWYWIIRAEMSIYAFDNKLSSREQKKYFLYIKTLKYFFTERMLLSNMGYGDDDKNHFYKDALICYTRYIEDDNGGICDYCEFEKRMKKSYKDIEKVIYYIVNIGEEKTNYNYTVLKGFHILLVKFLNEFGHFYQRTSDVKFHKLLYEYRDLNNKNELVKYFERNKVLKYLKREMVLLGVNKEQISDIVKKENVGT